MSDLLNFKSLVKKKPKPSWLRVKFPNSREYYQTRNLMRSLKLNTVCEEAACPNIGECWEKRHATLMILGDICTRACAFCNIKTGKPQQVDDLEPMHVSEAVAGLGLNHVVITSVDRDDLHDGGAAHWVRVIKAVREKSPETTIEVLTPDFRKKIGSVDLVAAAEPDVFNHNLETVPRLYRKVRPGARYYTSLRLLERVKEVNEKIFTKSGIMLGLGENSDEVFQVMDDMRSAGVEFLTIGQYLQPTVNHINVEEYISPYKFSTYAEKAKSKGFLMVSSTPLTRSSYHADSDFQKLKENMSKKL